MVTEGSNGFAEASSRFCSSGFASANCATATSLLQNDYSSKQQVGSSKFAEESFLQLATCLLQNVC